MQGYTDSLFNVGGVPRAHWGDLAAYMQNISHWPYPDPYKIWFFKPYNEYQITYINNLIDKILSENNPEVGAIRADNIFIAARYLNINGLLEAGRPINETILEGWANNKITAYQNLIRWGIMQSVNYKDYPLLTNEIGLNLYYDPVQNAIVLDPLAVRGGYVELFGQIINTGTGKIVALDGFGRINVVNNTTYDLIIKGLDTGIGTPERSLSLIRLRKKTAKIRSF
jgi:hypothetical protein